MRRAITRIRASLSLTFFSYCSLPRSRSHIHTCIHAHTHHGHSPTGRDSRHFYVTIATCMARRTAADHDWLSVIIPPDRTNGYRCRNIHIRSRVGLPRLFKFTLTVHSSYRRTPAVAPAAPNVTHDKSALFVREPTNHSHAHRVYFNRDAIRRHRSAPFTIVGETAKMAAAVT